MVNPAHRPRAHQLRAGGGGDRAAVEQRPEPAEHPDPHRRGPAHPRGLHRAAGARRSSRPTTRRSSCASWRTSRGDAGPAARLRATAWTCTARPRPRSSASPLDEVTQRAAPLRQGHQLRPDLRHERVRPGRQPRHRAQRGATAYIERYFARYPGVKRYMDETRAPAHEQRLRRDACSAGACGCPRSSSGNGPRRSGAERQAINAPMQGTAADLIKLAMIAVQERARPRAAGDADDHAGARRAGVRGARRPSSTGRASEVPRLMAGVATLAVPLRRRGRRRRRTGTRRTDRPRVGVGAA